MSLPMIGKRLLRALIVAWGVSLIAFALVRLVPGDPVALLLGDFATPEAVERLRRQLHLGGTILEQYSAFAGDLARGDLGTSIVTRQPVAGTIAATLPVTLWLTAGAMTFATIVAIPLGTFAGTASSSTVRHAFRVATSAILAVPVFVSALVLLLLLGVQFTVLPVAGYDPSFPANLRFLVLPSMASGLATGMVLARVVERSIRDTNTQEFVETAIVWGLPRRTLFWTYLVRPSIAPVIGLMGYVIGASLASAVILETVFAMPGVGSYLVSGVLARDYPVVQGTIFVFGLVVVIVHFLADSVSGWIDPRARAL